MTKTLISSFKHCQVVISLTILCGMVTIFITLHTPSNIEAAKDSTDISDSGIHQRILVLQKELLLLQNQLRVKNNANLNCATKALEPPKSSISLEPMVTAGDMKLSSGVNKWGIPMANSTLTIEDLEGKPQIVSFDQEPYSQTNLRIFCDYYINRQNLIFSYVQLNKRIREYTNKEANTWIIRLFALSTRQILPYYYPPISRWIMAYINIFSIVISPYFK